MATETNIVGVEAETDEQSFAAMLEETFNENETLEGSVVKGTIIGIEGDVVLVDVGLKSEGRIPIREFGRGEESQESPVNIGEIVDIYLERMEDRNGEAMLSREKARREEAWTVMEKAFENGERVDGTIFGRVKVGLPLIYRERWLSCPVAK